MKQINDVNVESIIALTPPSVILSELPASELTKKGVVEGRREIQNILKGDDKRLMVIAGPCSIHDTEAAMEFAPEDEGPA